MKVCIYLEQHQIKTTSPSFCCTCGCLLFPILWWRHVPHSPKFTTLPTPHFDFTQLIPAKCHQTQMQQRSSSRFNTFGYYLIAAEFNQRRWRKSAGFNQPLPAALPGSLQQQQVRLINRTFGALFLAGITASSSPDEKIEDAGLRVKQATSPGPSHIWMRA